MKSFCASIFVEKNLWRIKNGLYQCFCWQWQWSLAIWKHAMKVILGPWTKDIRSGVKMWVYSSTRKASLNWPAQAPPVISTQPTLKISTWSSSNKSRREAVPNSMPWLTIQDARAGSSLIPKNIACELSRTVRFKPGCRIPPKPNPRSDRNHSLA